ncbi:lambda exonuclease family protein [Frigidibacter sp. MR17.24]|uniref:lambda exonuclease family protein n=1 Tax=Frigidibacter sp. MR17.24 TaxID=3127345 RepID=UPI0030130766
MEQRSTEWFEARLGKVTGSKISDVMAKGRSGAPSATRANYMAQLVAERLTGAPYESFQSAAMQHGTETEDQARAVYTMTTGNAVAEIGFCPHATIPMAGASPDGLIGEFGLIEIKCPNTATHIAALRGASIDGGYMKQMQFQMICTGRLWCDFVSFDPRMPDEMQLLVRRVDADFDMQEEITAEVRKFLAELDEMEADLRARFMAEAA